MVLLSLSELLLATKLDAPSGQPLKSETLLESSLLQQP
jgi:hypothetical protein